MRVLYLSYNGLLDPLGQSQVLQYLIGLAALGHKIVLLTYEKADEWANESHREAARRATADAGIRWIPLTYHRRPSWPATGYDVAVGGIRALFLVLRHRIEIVHARGYVMAVIALLLPLGPLRPVAPPSLLDEVFPAFWAAGKPGGGARLLILNRRDHAFISEGA